MVERTYSSSAWRDVRRLLILFRDRSAVHALDGGGVVVVNETSP
jgi:hypothetical protein